MFNIEEFLVGHMKSDAIRLFVKDAIADHAKKILDRDMVTEEERARVKAATGLDYGTYGLLAQYFTGLFVAGDPGPVIFQRDQEVLAVLPADEEPMVMSVSVPGKKRDAKNPGGRSRKTVEPKPVPRSPLRECEICRGPIHYKGMRTHKIKCARENASKRPSAEIPEIPVGKSPKSPLVFGPGYDYAREAANSKYGCPPRPPAHDPIPMREPSPGNEVIKVQCLECGKDFPNARELGVHRTREHFNGQSYNSSSLARAM